MSTFGSRLRKSRVTADLTLEELSDKIGTTKSAISRYENDLRVPNGDFIKNAAITLDVSTDYLLTGTETKSQNHRKTNPRIYKIAAHLDSDELSDTDLNDIEQFLQFVKNKKKK